MGVTGLLGLLKSIQRPCSLMEFQGKTVGVDAYGWLHRGSIACAADLALGRPTTKFVDFAMHRVRMLVHFGITPYLVFDGDRLPSKAGTEQDRAQRRAASLKLGQQLLAMGKSSQAYQELQKAVDITPQLARQLIDELKQNNIPYVVAPYEADSQLAYLEKKGIIDAVISEDSDLLVFGVRNLLTKLDQYGQCIVVRQDDFSSCREVNMAGWTLDDFRRMAILSGCDYLDSLPKIGLKTAHRIVRKYRSVHGIIRGINLEGKMHVPRDYEAAFIRAEMTFRYQWVFCPEQQQLVHLNTPQNAKELVGLACIGAHVAAETCQKIARGDLDPITKRTLFSAPSKTMRSKSLLPPPATESCTKTPSIKSYFTGKRTPLQELDPNSFTPSPNQGRLLAANQNRTWNSAPARSSNPGFARPSHSIPSPIANLPSQTETHPITKRKRLCQDLEERGESIQPRRSKFFSANSPVKYRHRSESAKRDFNIHSDDSLSEENVTPTKRPSVVVSPCDATVQDAILETPTIASSTPAAKRSFYSYQAKAKTTMSEPTTMKAKRADKPSAQASMENDDELPETDSACPAFTGRAFARYQPLASAGSEDLLVPDSEGDCEEQAGSLRDEVDEERLSADFGSSATAAESTSVNLRRFLYSGS